MKGLSRRALTGALVAVASSLALAGTASAGQDVFTPPGGGWVGIQAGATYSGAHNITNVSVQVVLGHACANGKDASNGTVYSGVCTGANGTASKAFCGCVSRYGMAYTDQVTGWGPGGSVNPGTGVYSFVSAWADF